MVLSMCLREKKIFHTCQAWSLFSQESLLLYSTYNLFISTAWNDLEMVLYPLNFMLLCLLYFHFFEIVFSFGAV